MLHCWKSDHQGPSLRRLGGSGGGHWGSAHSAGWWEPYSHSDGKEHTRLLCEGVKLARKAGSGHRAMSAERTLGPRHRAKYFLGKTITTPLWRYFWLQNGKGRNAGLQMQELTSQNSEQCVEPANSVPKLGPGAPALPWLFLVRCRRNRHPRHDFPGSRHQLRLLSALCHW